MLNIVIKTIPHDQQRYETVGDWVVTGDRLTIYISDMKNWRYEVLVAIHEFVEWALCRSDGVTQKEVDDFDRSFRGAGEPGDAPGAPYRHEHFVATNVEREVATHLGVDWLIYDNEVESL